MKFTLAENIPVAEIDDRYSMEFHDPEERERGPAADRESETVERPGTLFPPVLVHDRGRLSGFLGNTLLDRHRRSGAALKSALLLERGEADERDFLLCLAALKSELKGFNVVEKAMALKMFRDLDPGKRPLEWAPGAFLTLVGIGRNPDLVERHVSLAESSAALRRMVCRGDLHENTAFEIFRFPRQEWDLLARFVRALFLGTKKRSGIVSMMRDIADRDRVGAADLLDGPELRRILALSLDPPQVAERVFRYFERLRYPRMLEYRERFLSKLKEAGMGPALRLHVPRDFETWEFSMEFAFSSIEEFRCQVGKLAELGSGEPFRELMAMRGGVEDTGQSEGVRRP
jgi:hypothetical protein